MRDAFIAELHEIAARDDRVLLLSGDIGFKVFDKFRDDYPGRYLNMGIAEANMMGVSAGLAMSNKRPYAYTIIPFLTMRPFEQIRVDIAMQDQPVKIVGVGGGLAYDILGPTHHSIEDVGLMRGLPGMTVIVPSDPQETREAVRACHDLEGPVYIRLGKNGEPNLTDAASPFRIGEATTIREGSDAAIIGCGPILGAGLKAADILEESGISCRVVSMHTVKPLDRDAVLSAGESCRALVSLEEHSVLGGLGSAVAETLAEAGVGIPFRRLGVQDKFTFTVGSQDYLLERHGLSPEKIAAQLSALLSEPARSQTSEEYISV